METMSPAERPALVHGHIVAMHDGPDDDPEAPKDPQEYDIEETDHLRVLAIPANYTNGNRKVPGVCAICLCAYEPGDQVTWSAEDACQHAFHNDCLVPWLAKKNEPHCPVCRQSFCKVTYTTEAESMYDPPFTFSQSFSQALARARLEASLMTSINAGGGLPTETDSSNINNNGGGGGGGVELALVGTRPAATTSITAGQIPESGQDEEAPAPASPTLSRESGPDVEQRNTAAASNNSNNNQTTSTSNQEDERT